MSEVLRNDKDVVMAAVMAAVRQDGEAFQFASEELQNDKEYVLALVSKNVCL